MATFLFQNDECFSRNFSRPFPSPLSRRPLSDEFDRWSENVDENNLPEADNIDRENTIFCPSPDRLQIHGEVPSLATSLSVNVKPLPIIPAQPDSTILTRSLSNRDSSSAMRAFKNLSSRPSSRGSQRSRTSSPHRSQRLTKEQPRTKPRQVSSEAELRREVQGTTPSTDETAEPGSNDRPILHFRSYLWRYLDRDRSNLNLDLFWPQNIEEESDSQSDASDHKDVFALEDMRPLIEFRHLRSLKLSGMLISYQKYIWMACWLNAGLEDLVLEMALEPEIRKECRPLWPKMQGDWKVRKANEGSTSYLGDNGAGVLHDSYGFGEYLDAKAIKSAYKTTVMMGVNLRYLPIVNLVLVGFVVDACPFVRYFNPMRLRQIEFRRDCVDAGFVLPRGMGQLVDVVGGAKETCQVEKLLKTDGQSAHLVSIKPERHTDEADVATLAKRVGNLLGRKRSVLARERFALERHNHGASCSFHN